MRSSGEGSSRVGAWRIATLAVAGALLVQCSSAPPPPAATSSPSVANAVTVCRQAAARHEPSTRCRDSAGQRRRPRPELASRLPTRPAAAAPGRGQLHRLRRTDPPRRPDRARRPGGGGRRDLRATSSTALSDREDPHGGQLSGRRRRVVHGRQQHLGVQLPRHPRHRPLVSARFRSSHRPQPAAQSRDRSDGCDPTQDRRRPTSTATAPTPESCTRGMLPCASSPIVVGAGAVTGDLPSTISTLSDDRRHIAGPITHCRRDAGPGPPPSPLHPADSRSVDCLADGLSSRAELHRYLSLGPSKAWFR